MMTLQARFVLIAMLAITCFNSTLEAEDPVKISNSSEDSEPTGEDTTSSEDSQPTGESSINNSSDDEGEYTASIIVLAILLAALILCNIAGCYFMSKKSKKNKPGTPPYGIEGSAQPLPPLVEVTQELELARNELDTERKRRIQAEALIQRATPGGIRVSDFPSVGDVNQHLEYLPTFVLKWTDKACAIAGSDPALPMTMQTILVQTFEVCRDEVKRCMANRVNSLSDFMGSKEPVSLGGKMTLDTSYVLYECLTRNFESIVPVEPDHIRSLASDILQRCASVADERLTKQMVTGDAWPLFEAVMQNYIRIFIECALQNGPMLFNDDVGKKTTFDAFSHRDWAPHSATPVGSNAA